MRLRLMTRRKGPRRQTTWPSVIMYSTFSSQIRGPCRHAKPIVVVQAANRRSGAGEAASPQAATKAKHVEEAATMNQSSATALNRGGVATTCGLPCQMIVSPNWGSLAKAHLVKRIVFASPT